MPDDHLWLPSAASTFTLGKGPVLTVSRETLIVNELDPVTAAVLNQCQGVRPLQGHIGQAWTSGASSSPSVIADAVDALIEHGLLREMPPRSPAASARPLCHIETAAIVTADRPQMLAQALQALSRPRATPLEVIIVDGSRSCETDTRATVQCANDAGDLRCWYVGAAEAARLRRHLAARGVPGSVLEASLAPGEIGSGRNIAMLLSAGRPLMMQDDDVVAEAWVDDEAATGVEVGGHADLRTWRFFESREEVRAAIRPVEMDIVAAHGAALGCTLGDLLGGTAGDVQFEQACAHMTAATNDAESRTVRVTFAGLAGDAGRYCSHGVLFRTGTVRQQLWDDESVLALATTSREIAVAAPRLIVTHDPKCMGYCMGVDNTTLVPPFMPLGRNEDGVWGALLAFMDPHALYAHLPYGVRHESHRPTRYDELMPSARQSRISEFLIFVISRVAPATFASAPADRLRHAGRLFTDIAALPAAEFRTLVAEAKLSVRSQELSHADATARDPSCPPHWRRAVDEYQRVFRESVRRRDYFLPIEFHCGSLNDGFARMQRFVGQFGQLLTWWPEMWEGAREVRSTK